MCAAMRNKNAGNELYQQGKYEAAIELYEKALSILEGSTLEAEKAKEVSV
jgi:hypothetical protein